MYHCLCNIYLQPLFAVISGLNLKEVNAPLQFQIFVLAHHKLRLSFLLEFVLAFKKQLKI